MVKQDEPLHVRDNRLFNPDGTLREGVDIKPEVEKPAATAKPDTVPPPKTEAPRRPAESAKFQSVSGIDFQTFILSLASSVQISLGLVAHPVTGETEMDLNHAQQTIDILGLLEDKTAGNLMPEESGLMKQVLFQLRMQFVEVKRRTAAGVK